ncbi:MAG: DUF4115 domain-containing protein [Rhodospirillaceae bacterium]|jgi:cytoskeleton protein RodZ|nr:DUF4115 domain-containing protein [Rhodospirillaceae bacterium]
MIIKNQDIVSTVDTANNVGSILRKTREQNKQSIDFVSNVLKIREQYLRSIENGCLDNFLETPYIIGFVRSYAEYLGLNSKEIVCRFRKENIEVNNKNKLEFYSSILDKNKHTNFLLGIAIFASIALVLSQCLNVWFFKPVNNYSEFAPPIKNDSKLSKDSAISSSTKDIVDINQSKDINNVESNNNVKSNTQSSESSKNVSKLSSISTVQSTGTEKDLIPPNIIENNQNENTISSTITYNKDIKTETLGKNKLTEDSIVSSTSNVVLISKEDCWIEIRNRENKIMQQRLLYKGENYTIPSLEAGLIMTVGNAGGMSLLIDGKATKTLGHIGMVRRNIPLDTEWLKNNIELLRE